jgi:hypothetical protein
MTFDEAALKALRDAVFGEPDDEPDEPGEAQRLIVPREGNNPSVLRGDNDARFAAYLFGDDDLSGYEPDPPAPQTPSTLDAY